MAATVLPSLDKRIENVEQEARQLLHERTVAPEEPSLLNDPRHPGHGMFQQIRAHVRCIDRSMGRTPDHLSDNLSGYLAVASHVSGLNRVDKVAMSDDGSRVFAVQERMPRALSLMAQVETMQGVQTPLTQSSAAWHAAPNTPVHEPAPPSPTLVTTESQRPLMLQR